MSLPLACVLAAGLLLAACQKSEKKGTVLAQVGNATLTLEELRESFPAEYEQLIRREQYLDFIKRWIDDEVVYQQARKASLDEDPQVKRRVEKLARKLLIEEFLSRESAAEGFEPDETAMNQYYEMHREEFRRKDAEIKYAHIRVQTLKEAGDLRHRVGSDNAFLSQAASRSLDPVPESFAALPFRKVGELPGCLAAELAAARPGTVTAPAACPDGFYLARVLDRQEAGSLVPFAEAKESIAAILAVQRKDRLLDARVAQYKAGIAISYNLDQIPGLAEPPAAEPAAAMPPAPAEAAPAAPASPAAAPGEPSPSRAAAGAVEPAAAPPPPRRRKPRPAPPPAESIPPTPEAPPAAPSLDAAPGQAQEASPDVPTPANP